jgi:hypothetical protein
MTPSTVYERKRERLRSVASEYESQGYEVKLQPPPDDLPEFLTGFELDLIATGKGETVIVEVKTRNDLKNEQSVSALENALRNRPGWRFELIIDGPATERRETLPATQIRASLDEADELQQHGHLSAALLLLWSATEGALRLLATRENIELESLAPGYVLKRLYTLGLLGREQYQILDEIMRLRNQAAHGFQVSVTAKDPTRIAGVLRELLSEVEIRAA